MERYSYGNYDYTKGLHSKQCEIALHPSGVILSNSPASWLTYWKRENGTLYFTYPDGVLSHSINQVAVDLCYHGHRTDYKQNVVIWPIHDVKRTFKVLVATHETYYEKTQIRKNIELANIPSESVLYSVAGSNKTSLEGDLLYNERECWEYAALAAVVDHPNPPHYWFLIHDTNIPGPNFYSKLCEVDMTCDFDVIALNDFNQFNIAFYKHEFLVSYKDFLNSLNGMSKSEGVLAEYEAWIRGKSRFVSTMNYATAQTSKTVNIWGTPREETYLKEIDLHKYWYKAAPNTEHVNRP